MERIKLTRESFNGDLLECQSPINSFGTEGVSLNDLVVIPTAVLQFLLNSLNATEFYTIKRKVREAINDCKNMDEMLLVLSDIYLVRNTIDVANNGCKEWDDMRRNPNNYAPAAGGSEAIGDVEDVPRCRNCKCDISHGDTTPDGKYCSDNCKNEHEMS